MRKYLIITLLVVIFGGCATRYQGSTVGESTLQYVRTQGDGSITVRVSTTGRNYNDALSLAGKYALRQALFNGLPVPEGGFLAKPLVTEVNAQEKYQYFFTAFFSDNGDYKRFVSSEDKRSRSDMLAKGRTAVRTVTTVRILRSELQNYLIENNILKP